MCDYLFSFPISWPHKLSKPHNTQRISNLIFFGHTSQNVRTLMITLPVEIAMSCPHSTFLGGIGFLFCTPCHTGGLRIVILLWIPCIIALIAVRESVMPSCAYCGFLGILLCGFPCLLSLCILVKSSSPHEPMLLLALLVFDSTHAALPHMPLCSTPTFS